MPTNPLALNAEVDVIAVPLVARTVCELGDIEAAPGEAILIVRAEVAVPKLLPVPVIV